LKGDHRRIENRPGGTHPSAEQGAVRGSLMMGMVTGMFDRLRLGQSTNGEDTDYQENRQEFEGDSVHQPSPLLKMPLKNSNKTKLKNQYGAKPHGLQGSHVLRPG